jgi:ABC-type molybdate transport system permease subunit
MAEGRPVRDLAIVLVGARPAWQASLPLILPPTFVGFVLDMTLSVIMLVILKHHFGIIVQ